MLLSPRLNPATRRHTPQLPPPCKAHAPNRLLPTDANETLSDTSEQSDSRGWPLHEATVGVWDPPARGQRHTDQPRRCREQDARRATPPPPPLHTFWATLSSTLHLGALRFLVCVEGNPEVPQIKQRTHRCTPAAATVYGPA